MPRSRIILILILVMMVLATGCSGKIKDQSAKNFSKQGQISSQAGQNENKDDSGANQSSEAKIGGNPSNASSIDKSGQSSAEVVVKTGTKVSDEKASEILSDIDKQMDEVVNMLNNMDDVEESDLNLQGGNEK